jgi:hypothetical protein
MKIEKFSAARQQFIVRGNISVTARPRSLEGALSSAHTREPISYDSCYHLIKFLVA